MRTAKSAGVVFIPADQAGRPGIRGAAAPVSRGAFLKTGAAASGRRCWGANEPPCQYSRSESRHQCPGHGRRRAGNLRQIMLLVPFRPRAAHVVQFGAIVVEQRLSQRLPARSPWQAMHWRIEPFPSTLPSRFIQILYVTRCFKRSFEIQTFVCDQRMTGGDGARKILPRPRRRRSTARPGDCFGAQARVS